MEVPEGRRAGGKGRPATRQEGAGSEDAAAAVDAFADELAGGLNLFSGPLNLQDGTVYLADGEEATDQQIWYLPQLLEGMQGLSAAE